MVFYNYSQQAFFLLVLYEIMFFSELLGSWI